MPPDQSTVTNHVRPGYLPARRMLTEDDTPEVALALAAAAVREGRWLTVCAWCIEPEVKRALAGVENLSHGCCIVCAAEQLAEMGWDKAMAGGAA